MSDAIDKYFERIYSELHAIATHRLSREQANESLNPTALIHEAWLRLQGVVQIVDSNHFKALAARAMQRILVDRARSRKSEKRGGNANRVSLEDLDQTWCQPEQAIEIQDLLEAFEKRSPRKAELVRLRVFGGFKMEEIAGILGISLSTAEDDWAFASAWLRREWKKEKLDGS